MRPPGSFVFDRSRYAPKVCPVERIERLHTELDVRALADVSLLQQAEVPLLLPRAVEEKALAQFTGSIRGPDERSVLVEVGQGLAVDLERRIRVIDMAPSALLSAPAAALEIVISSIASARGKMLLKKPSLLLFALC